jgi:surface antigen
MSLATAPYLHTLVVESVTSSSITAVEANYVGCAVTRGRVITFTDLLNTKKVSNFTVYRAN